MMMAGGEITPAPGPPDPPEPAELIYELESPTTEADYDTEVSLFDEPKSFTILCSATFKNYNWTDWTQGVFGTGKGKYFRYGSIQNGNDYSEGAVAATANRYSAIIMNPGGSGSACSSMHSRDNSTKTRRFAIRYNHRTRKIEGITSSSGTTTRWWILSSDVSSNNTIKLLVGGATGTINEFKIYSGCLTDTEIGTFIAGT